MLTRITIFFIFHFFFQEFRGYVQSAGRARDKPAKFIVMAPKSLELKMRERLQSFADMERCLVERCHEEYPEDLEDEMENFDSLMSICPPFYPSQQSKARADLGNSAQIVNKYVSFSSASHSPSQNKTEKSVSLKTSSFFCFGAQAEDFFFTLY